MFLVRRVAVAPPRLLSTTNRGYPLPAFTGHNGCFLPRQGLLLVAMKHILTAGTDAASVLLFDPASLPDEVDGCEHPGDLFPKLEKQGRLVWISTDGDGGYLLHVYVDEAPPDGLVGLLKDPIRIEAFSVASGKLYFTGAEYGFHRDDSKLRKYSQMGSCCEIAPGSYGLELFRAEFPRDAIGASFRKRATGAEAFLIGLFNYALVGAVFAVVISGFFGLVSAVSSVKDAWRWWLVGFAPPTAALVAMTAIIYLLPAFKRGQRKWRESELECPNFVAVMTSKSR